MGSPPTWTEEQLELLRLLWLDNDAATVAERVGKSRNAVIGKARRLGLKAKLSQRYGPNHIPVIPKPKMWKPKPKVQAPEPEVSNIPIDPVPLLKAEHWQCRAVVDGKDELGLAIVCGKSIREGSSYCQEHYECFTTRGYYNVRTWPINK